MLKQFTEFPCSHQQYGLHEAHVQLPPPHMHTCPPWIAEAALATFENTQPITFGWSRCTPPWVDVLELEGGLLHPGVRCSEVR